MKICPGCGILNNDANATCHLCHKPFVSTANEQPLPTSPSPPPVAPPPAKVWPEAQRRAFGKLIGVFLTIGIAAAAIIVLSLYGKTDFYQFLWQVGLVGFLVGIISIAVPLKFLGIKNRKLAIAIVIAGFATFGLCHDRWEKSLPPEQQAKLAAERQQRAEEERRAQAEKKQQESQKQVRQQQQTEPDKAAVLAAALADQLRKQGSDVKVFGFDNVIIFDCTEALDPRTTCYFLYKRYPQTQLDVGLLHQMGVHKLFFKTEPGIFKDYAWSKDI